MPPTRDASPIAPEQLPPLRLSRVLHARPETVFRAWSSAGHVKRWFAPDTFTVPDATVEPWAGGAFSLTMRSPAGEEHRLRGSFAEFVPPTRLVIDMRVADQAGNDLFSAYTEVAFAVAPCGTQLDIVQTYTLLDPSKAWMIKGAPEGWNSTLQNLEREVVRMQGGEETGERSAVHATFHLERSYDAPVARVWRALTDPDAKATWFGPPVKWEPLEQHMDVRPGGSERLSGRWESGLVTTFDAVYHDVIANERLVYSYQMYQGDRKISVSLATMQLKSTGVRNPRESGR